MTGWCASLEAIKWTWYGVLNDDRKTESSLKAITSYTIAYYVNVQDNLLQYEIWHKKQESCLN